MAQATLQPRDEYAGHSLVQLDEVQRNELLRAGHVPASRRRRNIFVKKVLMKNMTIAHLTKVKATAYVNLRSQSIWMVSMYSAQRKTPLTKAVNSSWDMTGLWMCDTAAKRHVKSGALTAW